MSTMNPNHGTRVAQDAGSFREGILSAVREHYARAAQGESGGGCCTTAGCCGGASATDARRAALAMGYDDASLATLPEGVNLGLGCGAPLSVASLRPGEVVLDLGSGAGIDCVLAAAEVGPTGRAIGVDMTPEMLSKARASAAGVGNVEYRLGEIEHLPLADRSVDVVISNCVVNLSPDKAAVWREVFRVLRPGGRVAISDVVRTAELPDDIARDLALHAGCVSGASSIDELERDLASAGFTDVRIEPKDESRAFIREWAPGRRAEEYVVSAYIHARRPLSRGCC